MYGETPAGCRRENMTIAIMDAGEDEAIHVLAGIIGPNEVYDEQDTVYINGGSKFTVQDLCRMASNYQLEQACGALGINIPE